MPDYMDRNDWSEWKYFPDPRKKEYLNAPFGFGLYQLKNVKLNQYILVGIGKNCAYRMSSLLPKPFGQGTRNNNIKRDYVMENISDIQYRTISFLTEIEMKQVENEIKKLNLHKFNT